MSILFILTLFSSCGVSFVRASPAPSSQVPIDHIGRQSAIEHGCLALLYRSEQNSCIILFYRVVPRVYRGVGVYTRRNIPLGLIVVVAIVTFAVLFVANSSAVKVGASFLCFLAKCAFAVCRPGRVIPVQRGSPIDEYFIFNRQWSRYATVHRD